MKRPLLLMLALLLMSAPAQAGWFSKKQDPVDLAEEAVRTYEPPPADALEIRCEPLRKKISKLNQGVIALRVFQGPYVEVLMARHRKCVEKVEQEKMQYLKHVDLQAPPALKPLNAETSDGGQ